MYYSIARCRTGYLTSISEFIFIRKVATVALPLLSVLLPVVLVLPVILPPLP